MSKPIIAVDADDTIFAETPAIREYMNRNYGLSHTEADYLTDGQYAGYWERIWKLEPSVMAEMFDAYMQSPDKAALRPVTGAINVLRELKRSYDLVVVTYRGADAVELTHNALVEHYPNLFEDVHFVPLWGNGEKVTKAKICTEIGASFLIDDGFEHCELAAAAGVSTVLFGDMGWNRWQELPERMTRCKDWSEVGEYFANRTIVKS